MTSSEKAIGEIEQVICEVMDSVLSRVQFDPQIFSRARPFHAALVPEEIWKGAKFERSFVTSLGQKAFEKIAVIIAKDVHGYAEQGYQLEGEITQGELTQINAILRELEHKGTQRREPNWLQELREVAQAQAGSEQALTVIVDLYVKSAAKEMFFEIKSSKPNADQSLQSKRKLLQIQAIKRGNPVETFFVFPDNPYEQKRIMVGLIPNATLL